MEVNPNTDMTLLIEEFQKRHRLDIKLMRLSNRNEAVRRKKLFSVERIPRQHYPL